MTEERRKYLMDEIIELEEEIAEAKKDGYKVDDLEKLRNEYLEELGEFNKEEAEKVHNEVIRDTNTYIATVYA